MCSGAEMEDDDVEDDDTSKSLKRMITYFQTLLGRKNTIKDKVTNIKVHNVQVTDLQSLMASQPLVLQKLVCLFGYLFMEARSNVDDVAHQIRKLHDDNVMDNHSTASATKFSVKYRKGTEE